MALLPRPFVLTPLQPEPTLPKPGGGWSGVLRWCHNFAVRGYGRLEDDPTLPGFDLFVLHVDADVAEKSYEDVSRDTPALAAAQGWPPLPRALPCPPPEDSVDVIRGCVLAWAGLREAGGRTVLCVPSKATDAWLVSALLSEGHRMLDRLECNLDLEATLPRPERVRKSKAQYLARQKEITAAWPAVRQRCSQAERFSREVSAMNFPTAR